MWAFKKRVDRYTVNVVSFNRESEKVAAGGLATAINGYRRLLAASASPTRACRQSRPNMVPDKGHVFAASSSGSRSNE